MRAYGVPRQCYTGGDDADFGKFGSKNYWKGHTARTVRSWFRSELKARRRRAYKKRARREGKFFLDGWVHNQNRLFCRRLGYGD